MSVLVGSNDGNESEETVSFHRNRLGPETGVTEEPPSNGAVRKKSALRKVTRFQLDQENPMPSSPVSPKKVTIKGGFALEAIPHPEATGNGLTKPPDEETPPAAETDTLQSPNEGKKTAVSINEVLGYFQDKWDRNRTQIQLQCFLFLLLGVIVTALIIFVAVSPPEKDVYQMEFSDCATVWPLKHHLSVFHDPELESALHVSWGHHNPSANGILPSYCREDETQCSTGRCCFRFPDHSEMLLSKYSPDSLTRCVRVRWKRDILFQQHSAEMHMNRSIWFKDCVALGTKKWYGGLLHYDDLSWPRKWNKTGLEGALTGERIGHGFMGLVEPSWISADGYAVWVESTQLLHVQAESSTTDESSLCIQSENYLQYSVCESSDVRHLFYAQHGAPDVPKPNSSLEMGNESLSILAEPENESFYERVSSTKLRNSSLILIGQNINDIFQNTTAFSAAEEKLFSQFSPKIRQHIDYSIVGLNVFNSSMNSRLLNCISSLKKSISHLRIAGEITNYISPSLLNSQPRFRSKAVWLDSEGERDESTGTVMRDQDLWAIIDITKTDVKDWFIRHIKETWSPYKQLDLLTGGGGTAAALPISASLNLTSGNPNFYSTAYAHTLSSIPKVISVPVGFRSSDIPLFLSLPVQLHNPESIIPLLLSSSLLGYDRILIDFAHSSTASRAQIFASLQLAMFFPAFRIPRQLLDDKIHVRLWKNVTESLWKLRSETIIPHYEKVWKEKAEGRLDGPVIRAVWWDDDGAILTNRGEVSNEELGISNQFMVGKDLVLGFFLNNSMVYMPRGVWKEPRTGKIIRMNKPVNRAMVFETDFACFERVSDRE